MRKVYLTVTVGVILTVDGDVDVSEVMDDMEISLDGSEDAEVVDAVIMDYKVTDSK